MQKIRKKFLEIFKNHRLTPFWAYKYDGLASDKNNSYTGIWVHADDAAINVNFWITPQSANLDPSSGGLVVHNTEALLGWNFNSFNNNEGKFREELLKGNQEKPSCLTMRIDSYCSIKIYFTKQITLSLKKDMKIGVLTSRCYLGEEQIKNTKEVLRHS